DDELVRLANRGELRANMQAQVARMIKDPRSRALSDNFAGQWLRARDVENMEIEPIGALGLQADFDRLQKEVWRLRHERHRQREESNRRGADENEKKDDAAKTAKS